MSFGGDRQAPNRWLRWTYVEGGQRYLTPLFGFVVAGTLIAAPFVLAIVWSYWYGSPADADIWAAVMEVHPDAGMACHAALVDRIDHMTGVLVGGPYAVVDDSSARPSRDVAEVLATGMVLEGDWRPPECGG